MKGSGGDSGGGQSGGPEGGSGRFVVVVNGGMGTGDVIGHDGDVMSGANGVVGSRGCGTTGGEASGTTGANGDEPCVAISYWQLGEPGGSSMSMRVGMMMRPSVALKNNGVTLRWRLRWPMARREWRALVDGGSREGSSTRYSYSFIWYQVELINRTRKIIKSIVCVLLIELLVACGSSGDFRFDGSLGLFWAVCGPGRLFLVRPGWVLASVLDSVGVCADVRVLLGPGPRSACVCVAPFASGPSLVPVSLNSTSSSILPQSARRSGEKYTR